MIDKDENKYHGVHFTPEIKHNLKNIVESGIKHPNSNLIY
jgi:hypothetical protein